MFSRPYGIRFAIAQRTLPWEPILGATSAEILLGTRIPNILSTSHKNLVNFGPLTPEFTTLIWQQYWCVKLANRMSVLTRYHYCQKIWIAWEIESIMHGVVQTVIDEDIDEWQNLCNIFFVYTRDVVLSTWFNFRSIYHIHGGICKGGSHVFSPSLFIYCSIMLYYFLVRKLPSRKGKPFFPVTGFIYGRNLIFIIIIIVWLDRCWTLTFLRACFRLDDSALDNRRLPDQC